MSQLWASLVRRYIAGPEHPTKYRFVRWLGRHGMSRDGIVAAVYPDARLWLNPVDLVDYLLLRDGRYEPLTLDFLRANLRPADTAILAGVNNGLHAIVAAKAVGVTGRVIGCEPQPAALLRARQNVELNGVPEGSLTLVAAALASDPGLAQMPWPLLENRGAASFFDTGTGFMAPLVTLAELSRALGLGTVRLLLLDVQGYEVQAISGLGATLRPEIAVVEDHETQLTRAGVPRSSLYGRLKELGYALHDLYGEPVSQPGEVPVERNLVGVQPGCVVSWVRRREKVAAAR
ncbi:MAG TPA: FkbM family methyltransferase [Thermoanaerobaculia bacterium]|nr:FkbM family methyltransferase [Thermoanaerobaculia bacterium]